MIISNSNISSSNSLTFPHLFQHVFMTFKKKALCLITAAHMYKGWEIINEV